MIYEIDESCLVAVRTESLNIIALLEQLALDRRKCRNIVVAKREVLYELASIEKLSDVSRSVYKVLSNRMSERKLLLKNAKKYCRIVATETEKRIIVEGEQEIILLNIEMASLKDFTTYTLLLAENKADIEFYKFVGQYFVKKNKLGTLNIGFEGTNGGGSTISDVLAHIISEKNRMCLCIVDSDRKYANAAPGDTMQRIMSVVQGISQDYFEVLLLEMHEIENIIPLSVLQKVVDENKLGKQGLLFYQYLIGCDNTINSPMFYFDLKEGILKKSFILEEGADDEKQKKYRKKELYRQYWREYIEKYGIKIDESSNTVLVSGICEKVLKWSMKYLDNKENLIEVEDPIRQVWEKIGEKVYCWGCIGGRIAV